MKFEEDMLEKPLGHLNCSVRLTKPNEVDILSEVIDSHPEDLLALRMS